MEELIRHARAEITLRSTTQDLSQVPPKFDAVDLCGSRHQCLKTTSIRATGHVPS
jgi:hypothetical protein